MKDLYPDRVPVVSFFVLFFNSQLQRVPVIVDLTRANGGFVLNILFSFMCSTDADMPGRGLDVALKGLFKRRITSMDWGFNRRRSEKKNH